MGKSNLLGAWGESVAADFLLKKRYQLIARGFNSRYGEIDLIVRNRKYIVFVEVKLRKSAAFARAADFVDRNKQDRLRTTAELYLSQNPTELQPRFDVIEVYAPDGEATKHPKIYHLEDAFQ